MDMEEIRKILLGDKESQLIDEEIERRYKTRNLFRPNAGSSDDAAVQERVRMLRMPEARASIQAKKIPEHDTTQVEEPLEITKPVDLEGVVETPEIIIPRMSDPYSSGDNIYLELLTYFKSNKLNGDPVPLVLEEEANCLLVTIAASSRLSLIIEGKARSGKSLIIDKLSGLLPSVYSLKVCSNKSVFGNADVINKHDFLYISEFQSAIEGNPAIKEAMKLITENKDATNDSNGERQTLSGKITVLSTGADENKRTQQRDVEVSGRFILLKTNASPEKIRRICDYQDGLAMGVIPDVNFSQYDKLKAHIYDALNDSSSFENPFAKAFAAYLPETQKSVYYRTLYNALINGSTRFDRPNRVRKENNKLLTNIADIYLVHSLYHETYCDALAKLAAHSFSSVEKTLNDLEKEEKKQELEQELKAIDETKTAPVNWQKIWSAGYQHMAAHNAHLLDPWVAAQTKDSKVVVYDPIQKRDVYLCGVQDAA